MNGERFNRQDSSDARDRNDKIFDEMYVRFGVTDRDIQQVEIAIAEGSDFPDVADTNSNES